MDFKNIIADQQELVNKLLNKNIISREISSKKLLAYLSQPNILSVLGVRRCGKSTLSLLTLNNKNFIHINFDDERLFGISHNDLNNLLQNMYEFKNFEYIIFDEIQNIKGWELFLSRLRMNHKVIITGSNSNLLSSELSAYLTGRHIDIMLFPFSFKEHLNFKNIEIPEKLGFISTYKKATLIKELEEYLIHGGFPERYYFGEEILNSIYNDIIFKDVVAKGKVKYIDKLKKLANFFVSNFSREYSIRNLSKNLKINHITISKWVELLKECFLFFELPRFSISLKKRNFSNVKKLYVVDNGIINSQRINLFEEKGRFMENVIFIEFLRRKYYKKEKNIEIFYFKSKEGYEVDFLIIENGKIKKLIQACLIYSEKEILKRELRGLLHAKKDLKLSDDVSLEIITWDYEGIKEVNWWNLKGEIKFLPLWKWMLNF